MHSRNEKPCAISPCVVAGNGWLFFFLPSFFFTKIAWHCRTATRHVHARRFWYRHRLHVKCRHSRSPDVHFARANVAESDWTRATCNASSFRYVSCLKFVLYAYLRVSIRSSRRTHMKQSESWLNNFRGARRNKIDSALRLYNIYKRYNIIRYRREINSSQWSLWSCLKLGTNNYFSDCNVKSLLLPFYYAYGRFSQTEREP